MALSAHVGSFALNLGTGNQSVTGVGFQPKAIVFFLNRRTADGYAQEDDLGVGFAVSSSQRGAVAAYAADLVTQFGGRCDDTECLILTGNTGPAVGTADFVSMDADGFTVNVTVAPPAAIIVNYLALGGADLTNAKVGSVALNTSVGDQAVTGVGFQPDCLLLLTADLAGVFPQATTSSRIGFGMATDPAERACVLSESRNASPTQSQGAQRSDRCLVGTGGGTAFDYELDLASFDSDGFTLDVADAPTGAYKVLYLALKGGQYKIGVETQKTSTGTKATSGLGFQPRGMLLAGWNRVASAALDTTDNRLAVGASDGTNSGCIWGQATDNLTTPDANSRLIRTKALTHSTNPSTTDGEASMSSFDADGFTLNWTTADAVAREFVYLAFGDASGASPGGGGAANMLLMGVG